MRNRYEMKGAGVALWFLLPAFVMEQSRGSGEKYSLKTKEKSKKISCTSLYSF
jgi:hypothetical protein